MAKLFPEVHLYKYQRIPQDVFCSIFWEDHGDEMMIHLIQSLQEEDVPEETSQVLSSQSEPSVHIQNPTTETTKLNNTGCSPVKLLLGTNLDLKNPSEIRCKVKAKSDLTAAWNRAEVRQGWEEMGQQGIWPRTWAALITVIQIRCKTALWLGYNT